MTNDYADLSNILNQIGDPELYRFKIYSFSDNKYHEVKEYCAELEEQGEGYFVPA